MSTVKEHQVAFSTIIERKTRAKLSRAVRKYGDELKKATGVRVRVTHGMVIDMLLDKYVNDEEIKS